ncbi:DUF305 domain-containing protein [Microterricola viridarii]|uniref:DUF305 domain-containing protein n=1 Tax=Microterricola viridarii TaxID=412690 RepID=UPI0013658A33|nr:DUF305 domain-containing protein [Microterricola viridarii]
MRPLALGAAVAAVLLLAACTPVAGAPAPVAPSEATVPASANDTDLHFLAMMTPHHEQAVQMSDIVLAADEVTQQTRDIAERIRAGQQHEIDVMLGWVADWQQEPLLEQHSTHIANGMVTPERMDALAALGGADVERTFLEEMIFHHEGAIAMTQDQIDNGGYAELRELAQQMIDVQTAEVAEMTQLLGR